MPSTATVTATETSPSIPFPVQKKTRRILHLINGEYYSGAERVQDLLAMELPKFGYDVGFVCVKPEKFPEQRLCKDSQLYQLPMRSKFDLGIGKKIAKIFKDGNYEAIHAHTPRSVFAGRLAWRYLRCPFFYHVHSPAGKDSTRRFTNWLNQKIENWCLKPTNALICVSNSLANYMKSIGHSEKKLFVVQNGVPAMDKLFNRPVPKQNWILGTVALFRPRKGTEVLLHAIAELKKQGLSVRLNAVGPFVSDEYEKHLKELCWNLGIQSQVSWLGFQSNVREQFRKMDLFVLPSLFGEGLPMVVLESMSFGVPVVAAEVEGIPEAIRNKTDGLIFEPGNAGSLADQIKDVITGVHDWSTLRNNGYERQTKMFSDHSMAEGTAEIYDRLLSNTP